MTEAERRTTHFSYIIIIIVLVLAGALHLTTLLLAALFTHLVLTRLYFPKRGGKWVAVALFLILLCGAFYGLGYLAKQVVESLPKIADQAIPSIIQWAKQHQIELPFTDYESLKDAAMDTVKSQVHYIGSFAKAARGASTHFVFLVAGIVVAISSFFHPRLELDPSDTRPVRNNLYSLCCEAIAARFATLYRSFETVIGAQIVISAINTVLTAIFVLAMHLPYALVIIGLTFLCGLLPVVGNLISNAIIVGIGFTVSPTTALVSLVFLVVIHKLEYFLNSKIIGHRIRNPLWLTLIGLIVGERLMGIPGMILAPVLLNYIKLETAQLPADPAAACHASTPMQEESAPKN